MLTAELTGRNPGSSLAEDTDDLFVGKTLLYGDVLMWLMKTLLTSRCINQRGAGQFENELQRLQLHIVRVEELKVISRDELVDLYFYHFLQDKCVTQKQSDEFFHYVRDNFKYPIVIKGETERLIHEAAVRLTGAGKTLGADDLGMLRNIARRMVDSR